MADDPGDEAFPLPDVPAADDSSYEYPEPRRRDGFKAWHRPRKQYVREKQWTNAINDILDGRDPVDRLKYLGLPGLDLLDLRHIVATVCEPTGRVLEFVGYDTAAGGDGAQATELNISEVELRAHQLVHGPSRIRPDDFRHLASRDTAAWRAAEKVAPADVINLDLTGHLFSDGSVQGGRSYEAAVRELLALQIANPRPWLLLLTTKVDRETASLDKLTVLVQGLDRALSECTEVQEMLDRHAEAPFEAAAVESCSDADLRLFTVVATMRWIYDLVMGTAAVRCRPRLSSCFFYTSHSGGPGRDMASLVIRFDRRPVTLDDAVFEHPPTPDRDDDPCAELARYVARTAGGPDIDEVVAADPGLRAELVERSGALLTQARYSVDAYQQWVRDYTS